MAHKRRTRRCAAQLRATDDSEETALFSTNENNFSSPCVCCCSLPSFSFSPSRQPSRSSSSVECVRLGDPLPPGGLRSLSQTLSSRLCAARVSSFQPPPLSHTLCVSTISPPCGQFMNGTRGTVGVTRPNFTLHIFHSQKSLLFQAADAGETEEEERKKEATERKSSRTR